jgi:hypothetical protein
MYPAIPRFEAILANVDGGLEILGFVYMLADGHTSG